MEAVAEHLTGWRVWRALCVPGLSVECRDPALWVSCSAGDLRHATRNRTQQQPVLKPVWGRGRGSVSFLILALACERARAHTHTHTHARARAHTLTQHTCAHTRTRTHTHTTHTQHKHTHTHKRTHTNTLSLILCPQSVKNYSQSTGNNTIHKLSLWS